MSTYERYKIFAKNNEVDQRLDFQEQLRLNELDFPSTINYQFSSIDPSKKLRTSPRILKFLTSSSPSNGLPSQNTELSPTTDTFGDFHNTLTTSILSRFRTTKCFEEAIIEGEFQEAESKYQFKELNLNMRLRESDICSYSIGVATPSNPLKRFGSIYGSWQWSNMLGQCEYWNFLLKRAFFNPSQEFAAKASLALPYVSPKTFVQKYAFSAKALNLLPDLSTRQYCAKLQLRSVADPRWEYSLRTTSHHFLHSLNTTNGKVPNAAEHSNSIFNRTMQTYQNIVLCANFKNIQQGSKGQDSQFEEEQTTTTTTPTRQTELEVTNIRTSLGIGSNQSVFAKLSYNNQYIESVPLRVIGGFEFDGLLENKFLLSGAISLTPSSKLAFVERLALRDQIGYSNIGMNGLNVNCDADTYGSRFYATNSMKFYFTSFPFLQRLQINPFLHAFAAFVPTDLKTTDTNKIPQLLKQNLRLTAGFGFTFNISEYDKIDILYNFADFIPKPNNVDSFGKFQIQFYT